MFFRDKLFAWINGWNKEKVELKRMNDFDEEEPVLKHISQLNFSLFTNKYTRLRGENRPHNHHLRIQKQWIRVIRNAMRASNIQTIVTFLYAAKMHSLQTHLLLSNSMRNWKNHYQLRQDLRRSWANKAKLLLSNNQHQLITEIEKQVHQIRANRAALYLSSLNPYSPDFRFFFHQLNDFQFDTSAARIGYRKDLKNGQFTTATQTIEND